MLLKEVKTTLPEEESLFSSNNNNYFNNENLFINLLKNREIRILFSIINCHLNLKERDLGFFYFKLAIKLMEIILLKYPNDQILLSQLGCQYIQL
jgi:hypothetical protein